MWRTWQDLRYSLRAMRRAPGFTAAVVLSLALGIGANTAIFSIINAFMLRQLPVRAPGELVEVLKLYPGDPRMNFHTAGQYRYMRDHNNVFSGLIATAPNRISIRVENGQAETVDGEQVTGNYFPVLGIGAAIGRTIGPGDASDASAAAPVAVLSWSYWRDRFNSDPGIVGKKLYAGDAPVTIVGVAPREFRGVLAWLPTQVWISGGAGGGLIGRLKDGVTKEQAEAQLSLLYRRAQELERDPLTGRISLQLEGAGAGIALPVLRDRFAQPLIVLMAMVGAVLLLACANIAGMLLARAAAREREMALRVSLGAGRWQLTRQVLTESLSLSIAGAAAGLLLGWFGADALVRVILSGRPMPGVTQNLLIGIQPDRNVLLFTACLAILTGLAFGMAPALRSMAAAPARSLLAGPASGESRRARRFSASLVIAQVALSVVLVSVAGQFVQYLSQLRNNVGFERDRLLLISINPAGSGLNRQQLTGLYRDLLERLEAIPGVRSATLCGPTPISGAGASRFVIVEGHQEKREDRRYVSLAWVAPKYFQTLGIPLLAGRDFSLQDQGSSRVAIINQAMARYYFGEKSPIGEHVRIDRDPRTGGWYGGDQPYRIVGLAADSKYYEPREAPHRTLYFNAFQEDRVQSNFALRTTLEASSVAPAARHAVSQVHKDLSVSGVTTMADQVDAALVPQRLVALLSGTFGALACGLAAVGLYGLLAFTVARRTNEIGIRMALGATRADVSRAVLGKALKLAIWGLIVGLPIAIWAGRIAAHVIGDLPAGSPLPIAFGAIAILAVALLAAYFPTRRAARVDPMEALRYD